jgi:hypothetical protein
MIPERVMKHIKSHFPVSRTAMAEAASDAGSPAGGADVASSFKDMSQSLLKAIQRIPNVCRVAGRSPAPAPPALLLPGASVPVDLASPAGIKQLQRVCEQAPCGKGSKRVLDMSGACACLRACMCGGCSCTLLLSGLSSPVSPSVRKVLETDKATVQWPGLDAVLQQVRVGPSTLQ